MVGNAELLFDDLLDAGAGPEVVLEAVGLGPRKEEVLEVLEVLVGELRLGAVGVRPP